MDNTLPQPRRLPPAINLRVVMVLRRRDIAYGQGSVVGLPRRWPVLERHLPTAACKSGLTGRNALPQSSLSLAHYDL